MRRRCPRPSVTGAAHVTVTVNRRRAVEQIIVTMCTLNLNWLRHRSGTLFTPIVIISDVPYNIKFKF